MCGRIPLTEIVVIARLLYFLNTIPSSTSQVTTSGLLPLDDPPTFVLSNFGYKTDEVSSQPPLTIEITVGDPAIPGLDLTGFTYEVTWYARGEVTARRQKLTRQLTSRGNDVIEKLGFSSTGKNGYRLGEEIYATFRVRYYRLDRLGSSVEDESPWSELVTSQTYKTGILITPEGDIELKECDRNYSKIAVTLKTPVYCPTSSRNNNCVLGIRIFLERIPGTTFYWTSRQEGALSSCQISLDNSNLDKPLDVYLKGICDSVDERNDSVLLRFEYTQSTYFWNSFQLADKKITINDTSSRWCIFQGDPHMQTFDGLAYSYFGIGDFVLYKNVELKLEINARLWPCANEGASCICGIAIREENDVLILKGCNIQKPWKFGVKFETASPSSLSSIQVLRELTDNNEYQIFLRGGAEVTVSHTYNPDAGRSWVNTMIRVPDGNKVHQGMCGNYDGIAENDLGFGGDGLDYTDDPSGFGKSWRLVFDEESWFKKTPSYVAVVQKEMCSCGMRAGWWSETKPTLATRCGYYEENHFLAVRRSTEDITETLRTKGVARRDVNDDLSDSFGEDSDSEGEFNLDDFKQYEEIKVLSWPTTSGLTEVEVIQYCRGVIFDSSGADECENVTARRSVGNNTVLLQNCVKDVQITDELFWSSSALSTFQSQCEEALLVDYAEQAANETSSIQSDGTQAVLESVILVPRDEVPVCPGDCSRNGSCVDGSCVCREGKTGQDCSLDVNQPPILKGIYSNGLCDVRSRACQTTRLSGFGFLNSPDSKLTCHFGSFEVFNTTWNKTGVSNSTAAVLVDLYQVQCSLPGHPVSRDVDPYQTGSPVVGLEISVSNDGEKMSNIQKLIIYDGLCLACTTEANCTLKNNTCLINGRCYASGDRHFYETTKSCQPDSSTEDWTVNEDIVAPGEQSKDTTVIIVAAVIAPLVFLIALAVALRCYCVGAQRGGAEIDQDGSPEGFFFHY